MREILFKAKRKDNGEWVEGSLVQTTAVSVKSFIVESACYTFDKWDWLNLVEVDTETLCQYTETTDAHCNKIWENDIVKYDDEYGYVEWQAWQSAFAVVFNGWRMNLSEFNDFDLEVYGNAFDNPELLEVEE